MEEPTAFTTPSDDGATIRIFCTIAIWRASKHAIETGIADICIGTTDMTNNTAEIAIGCGNVG